MSREVAHAFLALLLIGGGCGGVTAVELERDGGDAAAALEHDAAAMQETGTAGDVQGEAIPHTTDGAVESKEKEATICPPDLGGSATFQVCVGAPMPRSDVRCALCETPMLRCWSGAFAFDANNQRYVCVLSCSDCPTKL